MSPGPATKEEPGSAARSARTVCLIGVGLTIVSAVVSVFFMDVREMANTPVPSRIFAASLFLFATMAVGGLVLSAIDEGWIHANTLLRVSRSEHPVRFWGRVFLFPACGAGLLVMGVFILTGYGDYLFAGE